MQIQVKDNVHVQVRDAATGELLAEQTHRNLVVNAGLNLIRDFLDGDAPTAPSHFGYGTGTSAVAAGDTALQAQVGSRDILTSKTGTNAQQQVYTYYLGSATANGNTLGEAGIFNAASGGTMLCRVKLTPTIVKTASIAVTFTWTINLGAS
jgi:hypothetical protein